MPVATERDLEDAVEAAEAAFKTWSQTTIDERKDAMKAYADGLKSYHEDLATVLTKECGKPVSAILE